MLQKQSARILLGARRFSHSQPLFYKLRWMPLVTRIEYHRSIMVYKSLNGLSPAYLGNMFQQIGIVHQRNTRNSYEQKLYVPFSKLQCGKCRFSVKGANQWNEIPKYIRDATTLNQFRALCLSQIFVVS